MDQQYREALAFRQVTLRKLAEGLFPTARERDLALDQAGVVFPGRGFQVLAFACDDPITVQRTRPPRDIALIWYGVANVTQELLGEACFCERASEEGDELILLLSSAQALEREWLTQRLSQALDFLADSLSLSCSVGVSDRTEDLDAIQVCREQALTAAKYNAVLPPRSVIFYGDVAAQERQRRGYPFPQEQRFLSAVAQRDRAGVRSAAAALWAQLLQCAARDVRPYLLQFAAALRAQLVKDRGGNVPAYFDEGALGQTYRLEGCVEQLTQASLAHLDHLEQRRLRQKEDVLSNVSALIRAHFPDPDLSIEELLERSGYSPGYARKLFQEVYHCTPHTYLLTVRMEEAQRLLRETDRSVKDITAAVGFNNPSYFYAVFKKQVGVSAQDYRARYRGGSPQG